MSRLAHAPALFKLLADDVRWRIVQALARSDRSGQELVRTLQRPPNLVSYHLQQLLQQRLVKQRRSAADRRDMYFSLQTETLRTLYAETGAVLHPALAQPAPMASIDAAAAPVRVLFLCTHNSARSQMAEAILRHLSQGQIDVHSAGSQPSDIHPLARQVMGARGISLAGQRAKPLSEFVGQPFDYIVTVCDVAREACPVFPGDPEQIHWSFPDPAAVAGQEPRRRAFERTASELVTRINYLLLVIKRLRQEGRQP